MEGGGIEGWDSKERGVVGRVQGRGTRDWSTRRGEIFQPEVRGVGNRDRVSERAQSAKRRKHGLVWRRQTQRILPIRSIPPALPGSLSFARVSCLGQTVNFLRSFSVRGGSSTNTA